MGAPVVPSAACDTPGISVYRIPKGNLVSLYQITFFWTPIFFALPAESFLALPGAGQAGNTPETRVQV